MSNVIVTKTDSRQAQRDFVRVVEGIYRDHPQYVPDLERDVRGLFGRRRGAVLAFSDIQPFVAYRVGYSGKRVDERIGDGVECVGRVVDDVECVGRVVAIVNRRANERWQTRAVRFSMLEFVDDIDVSRALLDAVTRWGRERGMDTMQGPMGVTDFDKEGMLVSDFHLSGTMNTIWNPPYYPQHMERLGLQKQVDWLQARIQIPQQVPARYSRVAQYAREQIGLRVVKLTRDDVLRRGYGQQVFRLLNEAYRPIFGFSELSEAQADSFVRQYVRLVDLQLVPVVVNDRGEVVGVAVTMGSLSEALQRSCGRLWPTGWFHLLRALKWRRADHADMLLIAIRPDYQGLGVNALFFDDLIPIYNKYGFRWAETGPQLEDNVRELSQWKPLHPEFVKRRRCYTLPLL